MTMLIPQGDAQFSGCGRYRYRLTRELGGKLTITFVMLNPSTADGTADNPTIRRCKGFARDWGYGRLVIVNLYAFRATKPNDMWRLVTHAEHGEGIRSEMMHMVGEDNDSAIVRAVCEARGFPRQVDDSTEFVIRDGRVSVPYDGIVVCAWGKGGTVDKKLLVEHAARVERVAKLIGGDLHCLGVNGDGSPKHPLYLPEDTEAQLWRGP